MDIRKSILVMSIMTSLAIHAQEAKAPPKLKDSISLELRTLQLQLSNANVQILQIQQQQTQWQNQFINVLRSALKDSGLDEGKYEIDPNTLEVKAKLEMKK